MHESSHGACNNQKNSIVTPSLGCVDPALCLTGAKYFHSVHLWYLSAHHHRILRLRHKSRYCTLTLLLFVLLLQSFTQGTQYHVELITLNSVVHTQVHAFWVDETSPKNNNRLLCLAIEITFLFRASQALSLHLKLSSGLQVVIAMLFTELQLLVDSW